MTRNRSLSSQLRQFQIQKLRRFRNLVQFAEKYEILLGQNVICQKIGTRNNTSHRRVGPCRSFRGIPQFSFRAFPIFPFRG